MTIVSALIIDTIEGRALPLRGDDIDTDRIIPARFLVSVTFEGLERHLFEDERRHLGGAHPLDREAYREAAILLVNRNFGCGSSREHAPQAIRRRGIRAVVGESFSEIFFGNALALGLPCLSVPKPAVERLMQLVEHDPAMRLTVSVRESCVRAGAERIDGAMPAPARDALVTGAWDATGLLLAAEDEVRRVVESLPYLHDFRTAATR